MAKSKPRPAKPPPPAAGKSSASDAMLSPPSYVLAAALLVVGLLLGYSRSSATAVPPPPPPTGVLVPAARGCGRYTSPIRGCSPRGKACGHLVVDDFASAEEVDALRAIAARGMALGGGAGGPTILDLQSGALSYGEKFIDVWVALNSSKTARPFRKDELTVYADVVERIRQLAERTFVQSGKDAAAAAAPAARRLHLTAPTFFSRISGTKAPKTAHDEYWHTHIDLDQYGSFVFTSLLYLADGGTDFEGGVFEFLPAGTPQETVGTADAGAGAAGTPVATVAPARGRLVLFTSGPEHPHRVTRVTAGERLALTIAFTCDGEAAVQDFLGRAVDEQSAD